MPSPDSVAYSTKMLPMPRKPRRLGGRPAERFKFDATFEEIATKVSRTPKPSARWVIPPERTRTVRTPKKRRK